MSMKPKKRILVIDDDPSIGRLLQAYFAGLYDVSSAQCVADGLLLAHAVQPDLVLMDVHMPGPTGIDGLIRIRELNPYIPVVMQSGSGGNETILAAQALGADGFLMKPYDFEELDTVVSNILELRAFTRACAHDGNCSASDPILSPFGEMSMAH